MTSVTMNLKLVRRFSLILKFVFLFLILMPKVTLWAAADIDGNGFTNLADAIKALKVIAGEDISAVNLQADVNGDNKIGLEEVIYILQISGELRGGLLNEIRLAINNATNAFTLSLAGLDKKNTAQTYLTSVFNHMGLEQTSQTLAAPPPNEIILPSPININFACGTVALDISTSTLTFTFTGEEVCSGITGTVKVIPALSNNTLSFDILYENVNVNECSINGASQTILVVESGQFTATHTFTNLAACGQTLNGTVTISYNPEGQVLVISGSSQNTYVINGSTVTTDLTYSYTPQNGFSGTATVNTNGQTYNIEFTNMKFDPTCGVPVSGSMTLNGIVLDFSQTSCDNPVVEVTINNFTFTLSLEDAIALIQQSGN